MAADAWKIYNKTKEFTGDGSIDNDADTFKARLYLSTSNAATLTNSLAADLTNEHATDSTAFGYVEQTLTSVTWVESAGTVTFDFADPSWTASGGSIVARFAVIYDDTPTSPLDPLIGFSLLDNAPADVTVTAGNTLTLNINVNGMYQVSGGS